MSAVAALDRDRSYAEGDLIAGKYLLDRLLDEGGMGSVWLAQNLDLDAPVAIKLVRFDASHRELADRLVREARVEAQLEHPAIVRVFDCGETESGDPFIVMELLEGMSLAAALELRGPMSVTSAAQTLLPIIDALAVAHDKGIVHRDIKPGNVFLSRATRHIQPKLLDFGIAKIERWSPDLKLTLEGTVLGSPSYMAPEQARGLSDVDHRADVWAICAVLYEAITGSPPFQGESYNAILRAIVEDDVTPLTMGSAERNLWPILERGFARDRARRFQSMRDLGTALSQFLLAHGVTRDVCGEPLVTTWPLSSGPDPPRDATPPGAPDDEPRQASRSRPRLLLVPEAGETAPEPEAAGRPDVGLTSSNATITADGPLRAQPGSRAAIVAAAVVLGGLLIWLTNDTAGSTPATASPNTAPAAPSGAPALRAETPEPSASADPSARAVVSPVVGRTDEHRVNDRAGARPKPQTSTDTKGPARRPNTGAALGEALGLKNPY